jgi:dihydropteroate synthase
MKGNPETMQSKAKYSDVTMEVLSFMSNQIRALRARGIHDIIIDPGFGFAKLDVHNFTLMKQLGSFKIFDCPILAGISRKSTIQRTLEVNADDALNGSTALHMYLLERGTNILRVHDVKEAREVIKLWQKLQ